MSRAFRHAAISGGLLCAPGTAWACSACAARGGWTPGLGWLVAGIILAPVSVALVVVKVVRKLDAKEPAGGERAG